MSIIPPRLLLARMGDPTVVDSWTIDDGTGEYWIGYPYKWQVTLTVSAQTHGSHLTPTPGQYNGLDVKVGDWFADFTSGTAVQVVEIASRTDTTVSAIVQDIERFNVFTDPTGQGTAIGGGDGAIFTLGDDGLPILTPMTPVYGSLAQNLAWQLDQISRFRYRNYLRSHYPVHQGGHGLSVGDLVVLDATGYSKASADDVVEAVVGSVSDIGIPGPEWFNFRPVGRVVEGLNPPLPGTPGALIYLDPNGALTLNKPTAWAKPIYIRLESADKGIFLDRNVEAVNKNGYSSQTYVVPSLAARNALQDLNEGDQALVKDVGNAEWSHYIYEGGGQWTLIVTQDASNSDSHSKQVQVTYVSDPSGMIAVVSDGRRIDEVVIQVTEAFNGTASLSVGTDADHERFMEAHQNDLSVTGDYKTDPASILNNNGSDTNIKYWLSTSGCTTGKAVISITYS